ncbi:hypothetical protein FRC14_007816 [Serendipita sp. 396]|nr:hypothetical protein FRC14_007816 [Serendipita sp. 396]
MVDDAVVTAKSAVNSEWRKAKKYICSLKCSGHWLMCCNLLDIGSWSYLPLLATANILTPPPAPTVPNPAPAPTVGSGTRVRPSEHI